MVEFRQDNDLLSKDYFKTHQNLLIILILFVVVFITRIPFRTEVLYHWDSVNFAYAMQEFDIAKDQPQPPGYIFYVMLTTGLNYWIKDAQLTMVLVGIVSSGLAVIALYILGKEIFNWQTGLVAALFFGLFSLVLVLWRNSSSAYAGCFSDRFMCVFFI